MIKVLVATPLGRGGNGGIDRLMDLVRDEVVHGRLEGMEVRFGITRGRGSIVFAPFVLAQFLAQVVFWRPDVVHINLASRGSTRRKLRVASLARALGIATVVHLHGAQYREFWAAASPRLSRAIGRMFTQAQQVVVLGRVWDEFVREKAPGSKVTILPNATRSPIMSRIPAEDVRVLFLGRLGARKGSRDLVDALASLADLPGWKATLAGDGEIAATKARADKVGIMSRVTIPGWVGPDQVAELIANSDILVLPSYDENLPMSVIEGMAAGLAIVATPVGAIKDIISDGESGLLVDPGDVAALSHAIYRLITNQSLRKTLGRNAEVVFKDRLEIDTYIPKLVSIWKSAADNQR